MPDGARSGHPGVQAQLDRLFARGPGTDVLGLDRITRLLARLGDPQTRLPPVFHVAGTNGKGSTCAFLCAALEAAGLRVHAYTSPHLVRFNERIRLAGRLIADEPLAELLREALDRAEDLNASFFEVTTAASFLAFSRTPADACVIEVGLGGRLDATNVLRPAACGIAQLGVDHEAFLGSDPAGIAAEKAGIARRGVPLVTMRYPPAVAAAVSSVADAAGAPVLAEGRDWSFEQTGSTMLLSDARGTVALPAPDLPGAHQAANLVLAAGMLRAQSRLAVPEQALAAAAAAQWPARMQRLDPAGPLARLLPPGGELRLDGGHNEAAAQAVARTAVEVAGGRPIHVVAGVLANKDVAALLQPLAGLVRSITAVPVPDHDHHSPSSLAALATSIGFPKASTAPNAEAALRALPWRTGDPAPLVLILGSLYLAGDVLRRNEEPPI